LSFVALDFFIERIQQLGATLQMKIAREAVVCPSVSWSSALLCITVCSSPVRRFPVFALLSL